MNSARPNNRVRIVQESYIPVAKVQLVEALLREIDQPDERQRFESFYRLIEAIYHFEYHQTSRELKQDLNLLSEVNEAGQIGLSLGAAIETVEDRFLTNFTTLMQKANFRLLSQAEIEVAEAEEYLFSLPVQIDWNKLDNEMLSRFIERHANVFGPTQPPDFAERILIFHRGVGVDTTEGVLFLAKVDVLVTSLLEWITKPLARIWKRTPERGETEGEPRADALQSEPADDGAVTDNDCVFEDRYVDRISLRSTGVGFRWLFRKTRIQEPTFQELVILFRFATPAGDGTESGRVKDRRVFVKAFRDIPMADLEVVFPEKRISMEPVDLIKLIVMGVIGVSMAVFKFFSAALSPLLWLAALASVGGYAGKVFAGFKAAKNRYEHLVTRSLYHKNLNNDLGVIFYVADALEEQEFKEAVLAYFVLAQDGEMTARQLDTRCELWLKQQFGVEVNFEIDDALSKLVRAQVVTQNIGCYAAQPLELALTGLDRKWDNFFQFHGTPAS